jgi:hypothetical protein
MSFKYFSEVRSSKELIFFNEVIKSIRLLKVFRIQYDDKGLINPENKS